MKDKRSFSCLPPLSLRGVAAAGCMTVLAAGLVACKSNPSSAPIVNNAAAADQGGPDPADANMASGASTSAQPTRVMGQSQSYTPQQQGESYQQQAPAPIQQAYNDQQGYSNQNQQPYDNGQANYDQGYAAGEQAEANTAPPPLPEYSQPPAPDPNDLWTPGYWNYANTGYYWVPGTWVAAPYYGALWTPPYWAYGSGHYRFHHGYWGQHIGYYGGINYGFGYIGVGYYGGYWHGHDFFYNRAVNNVNVVNVHNVYDRTVIVNNVTYREQPNVRTSFNGPGGINAQPRPFELAAAREQHTGPVPAQVALREQAATNRGNFYAQNQGRPAQVAFSHPPDARTPLPANTAQPFNHPGAPGPNQPNAQPFNRAGTPGVLPNTHIGTPVTQPTTHIGTPAYAGRPDTHIGTPAANQPFNHAGSPESNPGFNHGSEPGNRPGGFNNSVGNRPAAPSAVNHPAPEQPRVSQPTANPGFNRPTPQPNPGFNRSAPAAAPHVDAPRPAPTPAPHVEAPRPTPAPHAEAPRPTPSPAPHAEAPRPAPAQAPHVEAPHSGPAPAAHPEGGGHPR